MTRQLHSLIEGMEVVEVYSQNKDELIIVFGKTGFQFYIKAVLTPELSILTFPNDVKRARKNSIDLFPSIVGRSVNAVISFDLERCLGISLENDQTLVFKMFGRQANILLYKSGHVTELFKNQLTKDWELALQSLVGIEVHSLEAFQSLDCNYLKAFPTFGTQVQPYLQARKYDKVDPAAQWAILQELKMALQNPIYSLVQTGAEYRLFLLPTDSPIDQYPDPIAALNGFYLNYIKHYRFTRMQRTNLNLLTKKKKQVTSAMEKARKRLSKLHQTSLRDLGDLLMANMQQIPPRATEIELSHFHTNELVRIKLKEDLTPQANAAIYYRKAKNQKIEQQQLQKTVAQKAGVLELLEQQIEMINQAQDIQELKKYLKAQNLGQKEKQSVKTVPFRAFDHMGYTIWVGKSAANNDLLTQKYASKNDLWLHAKDVSGSHVVVKHQGSNFPKLVIERAAGLAAYYSKRKTDSLCPVAYTQKKYVRKPKGSPPGQVVLQQENVIWVKPEL
ncbi:MAG: NFACT RNA binding domain-containing protein [Cyclobacteriaceae bacterium]